MQTIEKSVISYDAYLKKQNVATKYLIINSEEFLDSIEMKDKATATKVILSLSKAGYKFIVYIDSIMSAVEPIKYFKSFNQIITNDLNKAVGMNQEFKGTKAVLLRNQSLVMLDGEVSLVKMLNKEE